MSKRGGASMSDESKEVRRKKRRVCNIIHNVTWIAESLTILVAVVFQLTMDVAFDQSPLLIQSVTEICPHLIFLRIFTPFAHLFNEQRIKLMVLEHGWICAIKAALKIDGFFRSTEPNRRNSFLEQRTAPTSSRVLAFKKLETVKKNDIIVDRIYNRTSSAPITPQVVTNYDHHDVLCPPNMETPANDNTGPLPNTVVSTNVHM